MGRTYINCNVDDDDCDDDDDILNTMSVAAIALSCLHFDCDMKLQILIDNNNEFSHAVLFCVFMD